MNPHAQRIRERAIAERLRRIRAQLAAERRASSTLPAAAFDRSLSIAERRAALERAGFGQRHVHPGRPAHSHVGGADRYHTHS